MLAALLASGAAVSLPARRVLAADDGSAAFVAWARMTARRADIAHASAITPFVAGKARVIALGEPTHGAAEPLLLRNAIIEELVTRHGVTSVALETGSTGARVLDAFVNDGAGQAASLARDNLSWGFGAFGANTALLQRLRDHNAAGGNVRFFGIDVPGGDESGGMSAAPRVLDAPLSLLARARDPQARALGERLKPLAAGLDHTYHARMSVEERAVLASAVAELGRVLSTMAGEPAALEGARHDAVMAATLLRMSEVWPEMNDARSVPPGFYRVTNVREQAMADNVLRILKHRPGRVAVFAHDGHVMNAPVAGGAWDAFTEAPLSMGVRLRRALGRDYRVTGMTAAQSAPSLPAGAVPGSLDRALAATGAPPFLLDLGKAPPGWVDAPQTMRTNFVTQSRLTPRPAFDAVIALGMLTPAPRLGA